MSSLCSSPVLYHNALALLRPCCPLSDFHLECCTDIYSGLLQRPLVRSAGTEAGMGNETRNTTLHNGRHQAVLRLENE